MNTLNRSGVVDLSQIVTPQTADGAEVSYSRVFTEVDFQEALSASVRFPVILLLTMDSAPETHALSDLLVRLTNKAAGRWLLAKVDVQTNPRVAQALQVQAVPVVVAFIGAQMAPLFQGTKDESEVSALLEQVVQTAVANGITGRAQPVPGGLTVSTGEEDAQQTPAADPRFLPADEALARGDFQGALTEFEKLLQANPRDTEAAAGKAQVSLLLRTVDLDGAETIAAANSAPNDVVAQLAAADIEVVTGELAAAFARLLRIIREQSGADQDAARKRLLELFATADPGDAAVAHARRELAAALF
ncbi:MAG: tetratricopeptide repeat protein [Propionibacteriaceae bacterium]|nr:tetratricopeptide repeat protein [Propionibacteriaceae bacterium]